MRSALDQLGALDPPVTSVLLEGGPHLAGAFLDAGEIDEMRLFLAPLLLGGRSARDPLEGEGVDAISDALRALTLDCEQGRGRRPDLRAPAGVVDGCSPGLVADLGTVAAVDATNDGVRLAIESPLARELPEGDSVAVNGVCLTAVGPVRRPLRRRRHARDAAPLLAGRGAQRARAVNLELALAADARLGGHIVQGHVDGVGAVRRGRARTASRAS